MFQSAAFDDFFVKVVNTLKPYLCDLVCIGGCASALYRYHDYASEMLFPYLGTKDLDWASPKKLREDRRKPVAELMAEGGFKEEKFGTGDRPVVKYLPRNGTPAAEVEFLCPESTMYL
jgi:hypothetical protein